MSIGEVLLILLMVALIILLSLGITMEKEDRTHYERQRDAMARASRTEKP